MANWGNVHLVVIGSRSSVLAFSMSARRRSKYFTREMRNGEGGDLSSERAHRTAGTKTWEKHFRFQTAHDDEREHFRRLSIRHPNCWFVMSYSDPDADDVGGHLVRDGQSRSFRMSTRQRAACYRRAGYDPNCNTEDNDVLFWEAQWMMMDACIERARAGTRTWSTTSSSPTTGGVQRH